MQKMLILIISLMPFSASAGTAYIPVQIEIVNMDDAIMNVLPPEYDPFAWQRSCCKGIELGTQTNEHPNCKELREAELLTEKECHG